MMNLVPFETPPLRSRQEIVRATTTTTTNPIIGSKDASSRSSNCFDGHLDLSLGMSMSCSETKASASHRSGNCSGDEVGCLSSGIATATPAIQLSAGHGRVGDLRAGAAWTSAFVESTAGFMHPWSLAARQQKAVAEKERRTPAAAYVQSEPPGTIPLPSTVGWPPVHTSRRNLITAMHTANQSDTTAATVLHGLKGVTLPPAGNNKSSVTSRDSTVIVETRTPPPANMFAKVYMDGYNIARKINLRAHGSYDSLSRVLTKMTRNFFCPADCSNVNTVEENSCSSDKFIFLYEDFEGDRMLVGDVPWELFLASAKRLYIVRNPKPEDKGHVDDEKNDGREKAINK